MERRYGSVAERQRAYRARVAERSHLRLATLQHLDLILATSEPGDRDAWEEMRRVIRTWRWREMEP